MLTFCLGNGGGGGDGAERGAAWKGGVGPGHGHGVTHPGCWVDGSDRLICTQGRGEEGGGGVKLFLFGQLASQKYRKQRCTHFEAE